LPCSDRPFGALSTIYFRFVSLWHVRCFFLHSSAAQTKPQAEPAAQKGPSPSPAPPPAVDQQQFISHWTTETGWSTQLELRNNQVNQALTVTPVLRAVDGTETPLLPVTVQPQDVKTLDVATAIGSSAPQLIGAYGSIALRYKSPGQANLYAVAMIMGVGHSLAFHIDGTGEDKTENIGSREGIWWLPNATVTSYLVLTNQGQSPLQTTVSVSDAAGKASTQTITLPARGMQRYSMREILAAAKLTGSYGGIEVTAANQAGSLDTLHVVFEETGGFSAVMKMFDYDPRVQLKQRDYAGTGKWTLRAPMLALSNPDPALAFPEGTVLQPQVFIRNITATPIDATLAFNWRTGATTGTTQPSSLHLTPYETRRIDVAALQDGNTLPQDAQWASVILTTNSLPEEVVAVSASYDQSFRYGAQTPFSDQLASHWAGSQWNYDPYHDSIITVGNGGSKPTQAAFTIFYNQGTQKYELDQTLQPGEQMWMDIGKLIRESTPDKNGKTLPSNLTSGSYEIRDLTNPGAGTLFEGKAIYDKTYGQVTYGCAECCGYGNPVVLAFNPIEVPFEGTADNGVFAYDYCQDASVPVSTSFYGHWSSGNTGVVTVNTDGTFTGIAVGSTTTSTLGELNSNLIKNGCPLNDFSPSGTANTTPTVAFLGTNNFIFDGSDPTVTPFNIQAVQGTPNNGTFTWNESSTSSYNPSISFNGSASPYSTTAAQVTLTANGPSSSAGDTTLTVNYSVSGQSAQNPATRAITIRIFEYLLQSGNIAVIPISSSNPPQYGYTSYVYYNIYTNPGGQLLQQGYANISVYETVSITNYNFPITEITGTGGTTENSQIADTLSIYGSSPLPSNFSATATQYIAVGGFNVRVNTISWSQTGPSITNLGPYS
jgi:hypothetical protein